MDPVIDKIMKAYDAHVRTAGDSGALTPDFGSVKVRKIPRAWDAVSGDYTIEATFEDPVLNGYRAVLIEDTLAPAYADDEDPLSPHRITTMVVRYPRVILPEFNTHRVFSRNSASSRARSMKTTLRPVMVDPYVPLWTTNQKGMSGSFASIDHARHAAIRWLQARDRAVEGVFGLLMDPDFDGVSAPLWKSWGPTIDIYSTLYGNESIPEDWSNIHKQDANRLLEPWMWHETLVTSTYWKNFLDLRISDDAMPEIHAIAVLMRAILMESRDRGTLRRSTIHAPFLDGVELSKAGSWDDLETELLRSASECARISYRDRSIMRNKENDAADSLGRRLLAQRHMSPFEHIAWSSDRNDYESVPALAEIMRKMTLEDRDMSSNLSTDWTQFRRVESPREQ